MIDTYCSICRLEAEYPIRNMFKLFICAVCQIEMKPGEGISVHADSSQPGKLRPWDGPFLCLSCQEKKEAMEGKKRSRGLILLLAHFQIFSLLFTCKLIIHSLLFLITQIPHLVRVLQVSSHCHSSCRHS